MTKGGVRTPGPGKTLGRNPLPDKERKQPYTTRIRPDHKAWLKKQKNAAVEIEKALDEHIKNKK